MKMIPLRFSTLVVLFVLGACSSEPDGPVKAAEKPKDPEPIKRIELLTEPEEDVFTTTKATADYPELKITISVQTGPAPLAFLLRSKSEFIATLRSVAVSIRSLRA